MKRLIGLVIIILVVMIVLPAMQMCNLPALQAQAMIEMAQANAETARAAQSAANSANTLAWTLGGSVLLLALTAAALVGISIFLRVRKEINPQQFAAPRQLQGSITPRTEPALPSPGDPMQQLMQLQAMLMLQDMQRQNRAGLPVPQPTHQPVDVEEVWR